MFRNHHVLSFLFVVDHVPFTSYNILRSKDIGFVCYTLHVIIILWNGFMNLLLYQSHRRLVRNQKQASSKSHKTSKLSSKQEIQITERF